MPVTNQNRVSASSRIKDPQLPIPTRRGQQVACGMEGYALNGITMTAQDALWTLRICEIPKFDDVVSGSCSQNVFSRGMEKDLADSAWRDVDSGHRFEIQGFPVFCTPTLEGRVVNLPDQNFAIFSTRGDDGVVEGGPIGV